MKEAFLILGVIVILLALTAIRYRRQIAGMIGLAKMLKEVKTSAQARSVPGESATGVALVNCSTCEVWVPENKASKRGNVYYCSEACARMPRHTGRN